MPTPPAAQAGRRSVGLAGRACADSSPQRAVAAATPPYFDTQVTDDSLDTATPLWFGMSGLFAGGDTDRVTIATPTGFTLSLVQPVGSTLGKAALSLTSSTGGSVTAYNGNLVVLGAQAWSANPAAQSCAPGPTTATWAIVTPGVEGTVEVPVAVVRSGTKYTLTVCFGGLLARHLVPTAASFWTSSGVRHPDAVWEVLLRQHRHPYGPTRTPIPREIMQVRSYGCSRATRPQADLRHGDAHPDRRWDARGGRSDRVGRAGDDLCPRRRVELAGEGDRDRGDRQRWRILVRREEGSMYTAMAMPTRRTTRTTRFPTTASAASVCRPRRGAASRRTSTVRQASVSRWSSPARHRLSRRPLRRLPRQL